MVRYILLTVVIVLAASGGAYVGNLVVENWSKPDYSSIGEEPVNAILEETPAVMAPDERRFLLVSEVTLPDDAEVIAVEIDGVHYAFPKLYMEGIGDHIVSEVIEGLPIAVTYCNETECVRVFTDQEATGKIDLLQNGLQDGGLALLLGDEVYLQESEEIPLDDYAFTVQRWGQWKTDHPDGQVLAEIIRSAEPPE